MSPHPPHKIPQRNLAVLALSASKAEWLEYDKRGEPRYASVDVVGESVNDLVRAAMSARTQAGGKQRRCRLALADGLLAHRVLAIPDLGKRELRAVLERKAAGSLARSGNAVAAPVFSAIDAGTSQDGTRNWLTLMMDREQVTALLIRLRRMRFRVQGVTSSTLAGLRRTSEFRTESGKAALIVAVSNRAVEVSLISGNQLASSDTLEGNLLENPQLVTGLLQLVRTAAAFWRKSQRGAEVAEVHVIGMPGDRGVLLAQAIGGALPGAEVHSDPSPEDDTPDSGRIALLTACLQTGPLAIDMHVPIPPHRLVAAAGLVACAGSLLLGFGIVQRAVEEPRAKLLHEVAELRGRAADLEHLERRQTAVAESMSLIERRMGRALELGKTAPDYSEVMSDVLGALQSRASLMSISVVAGSEGVHDLRFKALTGSAPLQALRIAREIEIALESVPRLSQVTVDLPTTFETSELANGFAIDVHALLEVPQ